MIFANLLISFLVSGLAFSSEFTPCSGINLNNKTKVSFNRILLAKSIDGINFERKKQILVDRASVPDVMVDKNGKVRVYFVIIGCQEKNMNNNPVVAISPDNGDSWKYHRLNIEAPIDGKKCKEPFGSPPPVDPEVILTTEGKYRLFATCPNSSMNKETPMTFMFESDDGINFKNGKLAFKPNKGFALDPVVLQIKKEWIMINGNMGPAKSIDGKFFKSEKFDLFCPYEFKNISNGKKQCYIVGDALYDMSKETYRMYLFSDKENNYFKSVMSKDGINWKIEQSETEFLLKNEIDKNLEYYKVRFPSVARLSDGSFLMAYESTIPGSPDKIVKDEGPEMKKNKKEKFNNRPPVKCDGICDHNEKFMKEKSACYKSDCLR